MKIIVYLPGLGYDYSDVSGYNYAERYMSSMDKMNPDKNIKYLLEKKELKYGFQNDIISQITSIYEYDSNIEDKKETHRIHEFYYADSLTEKFNSKNIILKLVLILFTLFSKSIVLIKTFVRSQFLNIKKRIEAVYFFTILSLIAIFAVILFPAILTSFTGLLNQVITNDAFQLSQSVINLDSWVVFSYWITTITALLTTIIPNFRSFISNTATEFLCLDYYLTISDNKLEIIGKLEALIERISENDDYDVVEIHGYSFGTIVLIDAIFPYGNKPALRLTKEVKRIVTIGCPHDFISTYYPNYFSERALPNNSSLKEWYNIYSEIDILSSNFRPDDKKENGSFKLLNSDIETQNIFFNIINPKSLNFWSHIGVIGIRAHKLFWGKGVDSSSCLNMLVEKNNKI
ncbi:hypothetical protein HSX10_16315 [Winogradskyella undariae]|uniref:hypothetical protein n=1 Tax=Winogradskyella undariae TaxID=1285465 RepID=UPI00156AAEFA|nr:hypothetical protein [Winogradskyella undariae]NRR93142.1 hypothetical protein [Winogradskyella undariae]